FENSSHSTGWSAKPMPINAWLTRPFLPRSGSHEIMRITFDVQNGIVQMTKSTVCAAVERMWKARKYASEKPSTSVTAHAASEKRSVDQYVFSVTHGSARSAQPAKIVA